MTSYIVCIGFCVGFVGGYLVGYAVIRAWRRS